LSGTRKKGDGSRKRQKVFNRVVLAVVLVVFIVITAYAFTRSTTVSLPLYLNRCIPPAGPYAYQSSPQLLLNISGVDYTIPAGIGINGSCLRPLDTVDATGVIHIVTDVDRNYTLGDFFLVWGNTFGVNFATFNQNQVLTYRADGSTHTISMIVNGSPNYSFQNYVFPRNASFRGNPALILINYK